LDSVLAAVMAAIGKYGTSVLTRGEEAAADATVGLGQRLLNRIRKHPESDAQIAKAVEGVAGNPGDDDYEGLLRGKITKALDRDGTLSTDLAELLKTAGHVVSTSGDRTAIVNRNTGILSLGDNADNTINER
jgi:hypothetical protein